jgi:hypothetical protein
MLGTNNTAELPSTPAAGRVRRHQGSGLIDIEQYS